MVQEIVKKDAAGRDRPVAKKLFINGKELKLKFTMPIWRDLEERVCILDDVYTVLHSKDRLKKENIPTMAEILCRGEITADEIMEECDPATMQALIDEIVMVISRAISMKEKKYDDHSVHDETLEEIEKKEHRAD